MIGIVPQEPVLWADSIKNNILYGNPDATMEQVRKVAQQANGRDNELFLFQYNVFF